MAVYAGILIFLEAALACIRVRDARKTKIENILNRGCSIIYVFPAHALPLIDGQRHHFKAVLTPFEQQLN